MVRSAGKDTLEAATSVPRPRGDSCTIGVILLRGGNLDLRPSPAGEEEGKDRGDVPAAEANPGVGPEEEEEEGTDR